MGCDGPVFTTDTSARVLTVVVTDAALVAGTGSGVVDEATVTELVIVVPSATVAGMWTVSVSRAVAPSRIRALVQVTGPVPVQAKPPLPVMDTNVVPAGSVSTTVTFSAAVGPLLWTSMT